MLVSLVYEPIIAWMEPRTKACVFIGYNDNQKWFLYLDQMIGNKLLSRHLIFHESMFPFSFSDSVLASSVLSEVSLITIFGNLHANSWSSGNDVPFPFESMPSAMAIQLA